ncbi:MAG TPA: HEAT repeat domain-containing protein, partial [Humisphaera sp.]
QVRHHAALGLALGGEASAAPLVFGPEGAKVLSAGHRLAAAVALGPAGEDQLVAFLDGDDEQARAHALILLMVLELKSADRVPTRCLAALASRDPRVRLRAARGLDTYRDPALFAQFVARLLADRSLGDRDDEKPWDVPAAAVDAVAELVAHGGPSVRARTVWLLRELFGKHQAGWDRAWSAHAERLAGDIAALQKAAAGRKPAASKYTPAQIEELAFGAYVGLAREQGGSVPNVDAQATARVRQSALTWLLELAKRSPAHARAARSVFTQALRDPAQPVRMQAFDQLLALGADTDQLGSDALESGHTDVGVRGLELLSGTGKGGSASAAGAAVLEQAMLARDDALALEAAGLLVAARGVAAVASAALGAAHEPVRLHGVALLVANFETIPDAAARLRAALTSRHFKVREAAAYALAQKKDPAAFDALVAMLADATDEARQAPVVAGLARLGDPRTPAALLDRLENDPSKTAAAGLLLREAAAFRQPAVADRLLAIMDRDAGRRLPAANALLTISGYDQPVENPNEDEDDDEASAPRDWEKRQHPRHDGVLAALAEKALAINSVERLTKLVPSLRWARGREV